MPTFTPPTIEGPRVPHDRELDAAQRRWFPRIRGATVGQNVWKDADGAWHTGGLTLTDFATAQVIYWGGSTHTITEAEADELEAAGYTVVR